MSSELLRSEKYFIQFLLETSEQQAKIVLYNPTNNQIQALSEIARNLISLQLPKKYSTVVKKNKRFLQLLGKDKTSFRSKLSTIRKHLSTFLKIIRMIKDSLILLL